MSDINLRLGLVCAKGFLSTRDEPGPIAIAMTGSVASAGAQTISTNATTINMGSVATAGYSYFRNTSTANFIEIGTGTGTSFVAFSKLFYGDAQIVRLGTNAPTAKADTAAGTLQYTILSA